MRGDHRCAPVRLPGPVGPPPHARGSLVGGVRQGGRARPTPACAGITCASAWTTCKTAAHPRMRGYHGHGYRSSQISPGPPPHARGSRAGGRRRDPRARPTPACAGITCALPPGSHPRTAHPRMRGDHSSGVGFRGRGTGPPPHARGSHRPKRRPAASARPTPACAGITCFGISTSVGEEAHPRMRGDHSPWVRYVRAAFGPPPHARGSRGSTRLHGDVPRPTPACAGITGDEGVLWILRAAHPRMRGDHADHPFEHAGGRGPPPHARGSRLRWRGR